MLEHSAVLIHWPTPGSCGMARLVVDAQTGEVLGQVVRGEADVSLFRRCLGAARWSVREETDGSLVALVERTWSGSSAIRIYDAEGQLVAIADGRRIVGPKGAVIAFCSPMPGRQGKIWRNVGGEEIATQCRFDRGERLEFQKSTIDDPFLRMAILSRQAVY